MPESLKVADQITEQLKTFLADMIPLMLLLCTNGLRERHWEEMSKITGIELDPKHTYNLNELQNLKLHEHVSEIEETCIGAVKEYSLEKLMDSMEEEWALQTRPHLDMRRSPTRRSFRACL